MNSDASMPEESPDQQRLNLASNSAFRALTEQKDQPVRTNPTQQMIPEEQISVEVLRQKFPDVRTLYEYMVERRGLYLPSWPKSGERPKCLTQRYLFDVMIGKAYSITKDKIKTPSETRRIMTKGENYKRIGKASRTTKLLFEEDREPKIDWLVTVIYSLKPDHEMFKSAFQDVRRTVPKDLWDEIKDLPNIQKKGARTFSINETERKWRKEEKVKKMRNREKIRIEETEKKLSNRRNKLKKLDEVEKEMLQKKEPSKK